MVRRLVAALAAVFAMLAAGNALATTRICRAEVEARACVCDHASAALVDDCCTGASSDLAAPDAFPLLAPHPVALHLARASAPTACGEPVPASLSAPPGYAHDAPARAPPVPRFLANRALLI